MPVVGIQIVQVQGNTEWRCFRARSGNWVAVCDPLGVTIESATWAELMEDIAEAINAMFHDLVSSDDLERFLRGQGWRLAGSMPPKPRDVWFDMPFVARAADRDPEAVLR